MTNDQSDFVSFELSRDKDQLYVFGDEAGLSRLRDTLDNLICNTNDGHFEHIHLMTPDWGGNELSTTQQGSDTTLLNHVKVYCIKGQAFQM